MQRCAAYLKDSVSRVSGAIRLQTPVGLCVCVCASRGRAVLGGGNRVDCAAAGSKVGVGGGGVRGVVGGVEWGCV